MSDKRGDLQSEQSPLFQSAPSQHEIPFQEDGKEIDAAHTAGILGSAETASGHSVYVFRTANGDTIIDWGDGTSRFNRVGAAVFASLLVGEIAEPEDTSPTDDEIEEPPPKSSGMAELVDELFPSDSDEFLQRMRQVIADWEAFTIDQGYDLEIRQENAVRAFLQTKALIDTEIAAYRRLLDRWFAQWE